MNGRSSSGGSRRWVGRLGYDSFILLSPPFFGLGLLAAAAPGPISAARLGVAALCLGVAMLPIVRRWARTVRYDGATLRRGFRRHAPSRVSAIELGESGVRYAARPYRAWLVLEDERWLLADGEDPAAVVCEVLLLSRRLKVPVRAAWGLPSSATLMLFADAHCSSVASPEAPSLTTTAFWYGQPQLRQSWVAVVIAGIGTCAVALGVLTRRAIEGSPVPVASWVLSLSLIPLFVVLARATLRSSWSARVGAALEIWRGQESRGPCFLRTALGRLKGVYLVRAGDLQHLLLVHDDGHCTAIPAQGPDAERLTRAFGGAES